MKVVLDDEAFDGQILRLVGSMYEGGVDYGEVYSTSRRIKAHDVESWHREWSATAQRLEKIGRTALEAKHEVTAHEAFLRASQYYRASGQFFIGYPNEKRTLPAYQKCESCFIQAMKLSPAVKFEYVKIPWKNGTFFPGYFIQPPQIAPEKKGHTLIINGGYDSVKEECYFFSGAAALRRGYNILLFDGPGQGLTLLEQNVVTIPDWENVMSYLIDYLYTRKEVDKSKIAVMGISLGGYQVPRAATVEKRINAIIADPGQISIGKKARQRLPLPESWQNTFPKDVPWLVLSLIRMTLNKKMADPSYGWTFRRNLRVHGLKELDEMFPEWDKYCYDPKDVTCPIFISFAEKDAIAADSKDLYEQVSSSEKKFVMYTEANGSHEHCESGNRASFNADCLDWLDDIFA
jgi:alpha-beta hydrolase superfamily lysophospholipase